MGNKTFDECVASQDLICVPGDQYAQIQFFFFCGQNPECFTEEPSKSGRALQRAKFNVEQYYSVVGLTSETKKTLELFEAYLPNFFKNVTNVYEELTAQHGMVSMRQVQHFLAKACVAMWQKFLCRRSQEREGGSVGVIIPSTSILLHF